MTIRRVWLARHWTSRLLSGSFVLLALIAFAASSIFYWYYHRPRPGNLQQTLFPGIEYVRDVRNEPRPLTIHIVTVDLDSPDISFLVTPPTIQDEYVLSAQTVSGFLQDHDLQLAINGDFFMPWHSSSPFDYYPRSNDPVNARGYTASQGDFYTQGYSHPSRFATLYINKDNQASIDNPIGSIYNALSGKPELLENGRRLRRLGNNSSEFYQPQPRTAVGIDEDNNTLILIVVDGRQPNYSEGMTLEELAGLLLEYGAESALNLDGGGSSTLVIEGDDDKPKRLNSPIDNRIPGRERPVANHLGIYVDQS